MGSEYKSKCFLSGSLVFEDNDELLYKLLTFGDENSSNIDYKKSNLIKTHLSSDYIEVYKRNSTVTLEKHDKNNNNFLKFELIYDQPLENLCQSFQTYTDYQKIIDKDGHKAPKKSILYYRFYYNNKKYIFLKLLPKEYIIEQPQDGGNLNKKQRRRQREKEHKQKLKELALAQEQLLNKIENLRDEQQNSKTNQENYEIIERQNEKMEELKQLELIKQQTILEQEKLEDLQDLEQTYEEERGIFAKRDEKPKMKTITTYIYDNGVPIYDKYDNHRSFDVEVIDYTYKNDDYKFYLRFTYPGTRERNEVDNEINNYNLHLRTGNEFFIPEIITKIFINKSNDVNKTIDQIDYIVKQRKSQGLL